MMKTILNCDCLEFLNTNIVSKFDTIFLDPPFNQGKVYNTYNDTRNIEEYWQWLLDILYKIYNNSNCGASIFFMQREKNIYQVIDILQKSNWIIKNIIIWKKMASAVPIQNNISKHYQIIVYATKGSKANVLNKLRIDLPLYPHQKVPRCNGISITNVWDDIRELTSGYFSGREPFRKDDGHIINKCQSPIKLLLRIILLSSMPGDLMFDPFAGMGTSLVVAKQLNRNYIGCEIDTLYYNIINNRLNILRECDDIEKFKNYYRYTNDIDIIWNHKK